MYRKEDKIMKLTIQFEWRKHEEPEHWSPDVIVANALKEAGYVTGPSSVQGDHFEDKPVIPFTDKEKYPHEEVAWPKKV